MLRGLLPNEIYDALCDSVDICLVNEIRLRVNKPIRYLVGSEFRTLYIDNEMMVASQSDIDSVLSTATARSMYAYNSQIAKGYIAYKGGIRIGIAGEGVLSNGNVMTFKNINSLVIRVPCEVKGVADPVINAIGDYSHNVLIISPPGGGKTTLLRDYVRQASNSGHNVLLIDERGEIASSQNGLSMLDIGANTDIITGTNKIYAYRVAVRSLSPDIVATDEVFGDDEIEAILDIIRSGLNVVATLHGDSIDGIRDSQYVRLLDAFHYVVTISISANGRRTEVTQL